MKGIIETHCHLDYLKSLDLPDVLEQAHQAGVEKIVTVAVEPANQDTVLKIARENQNVFCSQGVHPHHAKEWNDQCQEKIEQNLKDPKVIAIGEIGLDYHYDNSPRDIQRTIFEKQIQIAIDNKLPIIVHTRDAEEDTQTILKNFQKEITMPLVIHCYTSTIELAEYALAQNYFLGFTGIVTFKAAQNVRDVLSITPLENMVVETDAPFLAPIPHRGRENFPHYLPAIIERIAQEKSIEREELLEILYTNSHRLFAI